MGQEQIKEEFGYYALLGTHASAGDIEVRNRYYALARIFHPDKGGDPNEFARINAAYVAVRDTKARAMLAKRLALVGIPCAKCGVSGALRRQLSFTVVELRPCTACCGAAYLPLSA